MSTPNTDDSVMRTRPRPSRRRRILIISMLLILAAVALCWWHPWRKPINIIESINPKDGATMVWVPAGKFLMGETVTSEDLREAYDYDGWQGALQMALQAIRHEGRNGNAPPHTVDLDGYWIYKYEVTVAQYRTFCRATGRKMPPAPEWGWQDNHPVASVTWHDAEAYAKWAGVSLPTEAQWEKAARGTDRRAYPWGNTWDAAKCANRKNSQGPSHTGVWPVGSFLAGASPYGAMDMAGNVVEWCADWYQKDYYRTAPPRNPPGPAKGTLRVWRGSGWNIDYPLIFRDTCRSVNSPSEWTDSSGFRCVSASP